MPTDGQNSAPYICYVRSVHLTCTLHTPAMYASYQAHVWRWYVPVAGQKRAFNGRHRGVV
ncbi:MAG: hypothetical protein IJ196_07230 [Prevotella sp.]|nr:hypothetical protein [Prevotella sp.]